MRHMIVDDHHVAGFRMLEVGIKNDRSQSREDPWPGTNSIVGDIEPEHGEQPLPLVARTEDTLGNVTAASRFGARVPESPPLHAEINNERDDRQSPQRLRGKTSRK